MRILLVTGKGGVGTTTVAAATAATAAAGGSKVLVLSTGPGKSLADVLDVCLSDEPSEVDTGLYAMQVDPQRAVERCWRDLQDRLQPVLERAGLGAVQADELAVPPGADQVLALLELARQARTGPWDLVVADCPPTGQALRMLALPSVLSWYLAKAFPPERRVLRAVRPLLSRISGPAVPPAGVFDAVERLQAELTDVQGLLTGPLTSVRLVLTPERLVVAETRRALTSLSLYGYRVQELVANRVLPPGPDRGLLAGRATVQRAELDLLRSELDGLGDGGAGVPVLELAEQPGGPLGLTALVELGSSSDGWPGTAPGAYAGAGAGADLITVSRTADGFSLCLELPLARADELDLARSGDDLVVTVAGHRRVVTLPSVLRRCLVVGAVLERGRLDVRFEPDPALWMRS